MNRNMLPIVALAVIIGIMGLAQQVNADFGTHTIWMNIKNTKTDTVKTVEWTSERFLFEKNIPVDVDHLKVKKIKQIFGTNKFTFTWQMDNYEANWHQFQVSIGMKAQPGTTLRVTFI